MIAVVLWQATLNFLGAVLAFFYKAVPNYGVAIILLTLAMRVVLLPLGIKQIRSMQAMQSIQPKAKSIQQKYKGDRQRINEETMKLYKEYGVNPLGGCLPVVLQFPLLIALFAVLRVPGGARHIPHNRATAAVVSPANSRLYNDVRNQHTSFLGANLLCSAQQAGKNVPVKDKNGKPDPIIPELKCGKGAAVRLPYYLFALAMIGTTYYQQRQMQRASPPGASQQQQTLTKIMPLLFGVWGFIFPAGLVVYWTTTNLIQIAQQHFMLPKAPVGEGPKGGSTDGDRKPGQQKGGRGRSVGPALPPRGRTGGGPPRDRAPTEKGGASNPGTTPGTGGQQTSKPGPTEGSAGKRGSGGRNGRSRKKRRKR